MLNNIALTVQTRNYGNLDSKIVVDVSGGSHYNALQVGYSTSNEYWMVIFDRATLKVVENFTFTDNTTVPKQTTPYLGNGDYMYILTTNALNSSNLPTGAFYKWLINEGADVGLRSLEQIYGALNCSNWGAVSYMIVDIFGAGGTANTIEGYNVIDSALLSVLELQPITFGGKTLYTPVNLS